MNKFEQQKNEIRTWCRLQSMDKLKEIISAHKFRQDGTETTKWLWIIAETELDTRRELGDWKELVGAELPPIEQGTPPYSAGTPPQTRDDILEKKLQVEYRRIVADINKLKNEAFILETCQVPGHQQYARLLVDNLGTHLTAMKKVLDDIDAMWREAGYA